MIECFKSGLILRGILHDLSKFLPDEFFPYANFFYNKKNIFNKRTNCKNGYRKPTSTGDNRFDFAWLLHIKRNKHHWQWWVVPNENKGVNILPIPEPYITEMLCDWIGAGRAQGHRSPKDNPYLNVREWYKENQNKIQLEDGTRKEIEKRIGIKNKFL